MKNNKLLQKSIKNLQFICLFDIFAIILRPISIAHSNEHNVFDSSGT